MNMTTWARKHLKMNLRRDYAALMLLDSRRRRLTGGGLEGSGPGGELRQASGQPSIVVRESHCQSAPIAA